MSTKTTFKRFALVTVAALGFGLLSSVAPASAAEGDADEVTAISITTPAVGRVGSAFATPLGFTSASLDSTNEATFAGVTPMPAPDAANYKQLEELVEEDVISWLEATADKEHMQYRITKQITEKVAPKYVDTPLPWAPPVEEVVKPAV